MCGCRIRKRMVRRISLLIFLSSFVPLTGVRWPGRLAMGSLSINTLCPVSSSSLSTPFHEREIHNQ